MSPREKDLVRYTLAYAATRDGRRARSYTHSRLRPATTREIRDMVNGSKFSKIRAMVK